MIYKKIRGHKRIWREIDQWIEYHKDLDIDLLLQHKRHYVKFWVAPYCNLNLSNSTFMPPKYKTRQRIISGIFSMYHSWKKELDKLNKPYYLKIWYFHNDVSKCQVVCAIDEFLRFYDQTFFIPDKTKVCPNNFTNFTWQHAHQETHISQDDIDEKADTFYTYQDYLAQQKWINHIINHPKTRITETCLENGDKKTYYSLKECDVWIGGI